jgi:dipeptidyl-peptidase 4
MKNLFFLSAISLFINSSAIIQTNSTNTLTTKEIILKEIWNITFSPERMNSLNSMKGDYYAILNYNRELGAVTLDKYSYKTLKKVETIVNSANLKGLENLQ